MVFFFGLCRCLKSQIFILFVLCPNFVSFDASDIPSFIMRLSSGEQNQPCSSCSIVFLELSSHCQASTAAWEKNSALFWSSYRQWTMDQTWSNHLTYQGGSLRTPFLHWSARILIKWFHLRSAGRSQVNIPNNVCVSPAACLKVQTLKTNPRPSNMTFYHVLSPGLGELNPLRWSP